MRKKVTRKLVVLATILSLLLLMLAGCGGTGNKVNEVKIAFLNPLSGSNVDAGKQDLDAAQLAVEDINNAGGIKALGGAKLKLVVSDTTSDPKSAASVAERTFSTEKVAGAVGTGITALTMPILPIAEKSRIPIITNSINDQITQQGYKFTFQIAPKGSQFGSTQVDFLKWLNDKYKLGIKNIAVVYENSGYGVSTAAGVKDIAQKAGLNISLYESYPHGFTDASSLVTDIKKSGAQALFPVAYTTDAKLIINTMKAMNVNMPIIGGGAGFLWPAFGQEMGNNVNGFISVASWNWDSKNITSNPDLAAVPERFEKKYGYFMTEHAGPTYTAVWLLAEAMEQAKSADPIKVREALAKFDMDNGMPALMQPGHVKFDANGFNSLVHPVMIQWQDNKPRTIFPESDATRSYQPAK
ncbi:MAG: branched-chain amino acid transport system substrate-binding protein [Moorella sp. (in: firmicutes)]|nr:branched-chain amino acid transport system substrate-binding protein [Moorella sp. (in: firmicutes)]